MNSNENEKKANLVPRMERCARYLISDPAQYRGHWRDLKPDARELRLEIGCGKGSFTVETAAAHPEVLFVAVERVADCLLLAMEKVMARGLDNVVFVCDDAARLGRCLPLARWTGCTSTSATPGPAKSTPNGG